MKNSHFRILTIILVLFSIISIAAMGDISWDEAVYIGMGKYLYSGGSAGLWETIRPIGLPVVLGLLWKFGLDAVLAAKIFSLLFSIGCIMMTYIVAQRLFNDNIALISSLMLMVSPLFLSSSSAALTGIPSTMLALLSIYLFLEDRPVAAGILAGFAFMFRFPQGLLFIGLLASSYVLRKNARKLMAGFAAAIAPFLLFSTVIYGNPFTPFMDAFSHQSNIVYSVITGSALSHIYNIFYYAVWIIRQNIVLIFFIPGIFLLLKQLRKKSSVVLFPLLLFLGYFTYIINKQPRFMLVFLPYVCMAAAYAIYVTVIRIKSAWLKKLLVAGLLIGGLFWGTGFRHDYLVAEQDPRAADFYTYFSTRGTDLPVLSTTPIPTTYSDIRIIHFYNNVYDAIEIYGEEKDNAGYIMYTSEFYPCSDEACKSKKDTLFSDINSSGELIYHKNLDQDYYIFRTYTSR